MELIHHKGIMNKEYRKYLRSKEWLEIRLDILTLRGNKCEKCFSKNKLQVHHLTYKNIFKEEPKDLIVLCDRCHENEHKKPKVNGGKLTLAQKVQRKKKMAKLKKKIKY